MFIEWVMISYMRIKLAEFITDILPGCEFVEQIGVTLDFQVSASTMRSLHARGLETSEALLGEWNSKHNKEDAHKIRASNRRASLKAYADSVKDENLHMKDSGNASLGLIFGTIEAVRHDFNIEEYAIAPTTLETIFNNFASGREDEKLKMLAEGFTTSASDNENNNENNDNENKTVKHKVTTVFHV
jgi:hypothetical protein